MRDPYRAVFHHLPVGAAWCRLLVERDRVVDLHVLDANAAFELRGTPPELLELLTLAWLRGAPQTRTLRIGGTAMSIAIHPLGGDEVTVVIEDSATNAQLERQLRESQDRFKQAFDGNAAAMVIASQQDLRIIDVNPRWLELFGATRAEVIGRTSVELGLIDEDVARSRVAEHRRFTGGYDTELALKTRGGEDLIVLASAKPIHIAEGPCTLTTLIDITARKRAEQAFGVVFGASPAGMILVDVESDRVIDANARMLEIAARPREAIVGRRAQELSLVAIPARQRVLDEVTRTGRAQNVELELERGDGTKLATLLSTELLSLHGRPHRLSVFTDISARKWLERRLATKHEIGRCLAEHAAIDAAVPGVLAALCRGEGWDGGALWLRNDDDGALTLRGVWRDPAVPEALADQIRRAALSLHGMLGRVLDTRRPEKIAIDASSGVLSEAASAAGLRRAIAFPILRGTASLGIVVLAARDARLELDDGELGLFDSAGRLIGLFVERTAAEVALRELNAELERRVEQRTQALETSNRDLEAFGSSVSHDLRAPLRAIHGFSEILLDDFAAQLPPDASELIDRIHASAGRLRAMVEDLLAFSRLGRTRLHVEPVDGDALVRTVIDDLLIGRPTDRLELRVLPLGTCRADPALLRAVWTNLIDNALKYARDRDPVVIEIGCERRGDDAVYYVRDNGVGFDMASADRLFTMFHRLHAAHEFEGSGIGLANVRRIVERHGGHIAARSAPGDGARFEFTLGRAP